jgi:exosome complex component RRP45
MVWSNLERTFILKALETQCRLDERALSEFRHIQFNFDNTRGHVTVRLGGTTVTAVVTASVIRPYPDRPAEGVINYYVNLSSLSLPIEEYQ